MTIEINASSPLQVDLLLELARSVGLYGDPKWRGILLQRACRGGEDSPLRLIRFEDYKVFIKLRVAYVYV